MVNSENDVENFQIIIDKKYRAVWEIDTLPGVSEYVQYDSKDPGKSKHYYLRGYPIGKVIPELNKYVLHNFINITIVVHPTGPTSFQIIGFNITPGNVRYSAESGCEPETDVVTGLEPGKNITYFYQINFEKSTKEWSSRWDVYLQNFGDTDIRWFAILNALAIVASLSFLAAQTLRRALKRDIDLYNQSDAEIGPIIEIGWKRLKSDVFRPPEHTLVLTALIATGFQLLVMVFACILCTLLGLVRSEIRGSLLSSMIVMFMLLGTGSGYIAGRFKGLLEVGLRSSLQTLTVTFFVPGCFFLYYGFLNLVLWLNKEHGTVSPFPTQQNIGATGGHLEDYHHVGLRRVPAHISGCETRTPPDAHPGALPAHQTAHRHTAAALVPPSAAHHLSWRPNTLRVSVRVNRRRE